jgi:hypothetical protein
MSIYALLSLLFAFIGFEQFSNFQSLIISYPMVYGIPVALIISFIATVTLKKED